MESQTVSLSSPSSSSSSSSLLSSPRSAFAPIPDIVTTRSIQFAAPGNNKEARLENKKYSGLRNINNGGITAGLIPRVLTADSDSESSLTEVEEDYNNGEKPGTCPCSLRLDAINAVNAECNSIRAKIKRHIREAS